MTSRQAGKRISELSRRRKPSGPRPSVQGKRQAPPTPAEKRRMTQLVICAAVFVLLVGVKLLLPGKLDRVRESVSGVMDRNMDVTEVFSAVGRAISGERSVQDSLGDVYQAVFHPAEAVETAAPADGAADPSAAMESLRAFADGTGSADGVIETCQQCHGTGQVRTVQNFMGMQMQSTSACPRCGGRGQVIKTPCTTCKGKGKVRRSHKITVKVPAGVDAGQSVRVRGEGCVGANGGPNGDLLVEISIRRHPLFQREDRDVLCEVPISFTQAALGATIQVPTLDGMVDYEIPEGTQTGREFILRDKGIPEVGNSRRRGNERFTVVVETPTRLTKEQKDLLRQLDGTMEVSPKRKKFANVIKDFFE